MMNRLMQILITLLGVFIGYELALIGAPVLCTLLGFTLGASAFMTLLVIGGLAGGLIFYGPLNNWTANPAYVLGRMSATKDANHRYYHRDYGIAGRALDCKLT